MTPLTGAGIFLSTLPARGATRNDKLRQSHTAISIHAPREGSDTDIITLWAASPPISIHAPREGSDIRPTTTAAGAKNFYPRSPRGERRLGGGGALHLCGNFYPRSPRGERPGAEGLDAAYSRISIHAPREGSDRLCDGFLRFPSKFLSTLPARGATLDLGAVFVYVVYFYPRSPRGERRGPRRSSSRPPRFLSTLPARGATTLKE